MRCERGQATIEWVGLVLLASLVLGALATAVPAGEGRSFGTFVSERIFCAIGGSGCRAGSEREIEAPDGSLAQRLSRGALGLRVSAVGPCTAYSCNPIGSVCTVVYKGRRGKAFCKARAAAEDPGALVGFLRLKFRECLVGASGARGFTPFAEELLKKDAAKSVRNAYRAIKRGLLRARSEIVKGRVRPGLIGCLGGTIGV